MIAVYHHIEFIGRGRFLAEYLFKECPLLLVDALQFFNGLPWVGAEDFRQPHAAVMVRTDQPDRKRAVYELLLIDP